MKQLNSNPTKRAILAGAAALTVITGALLPPPAPAAAATDLTARLTLGGTSGPNGAARTGERFTVTLRVSNPGAGANGADDFARNVRVEMPIDGATLVRDNAVTGTWATGFTCAASTANRLVCTGGDLQRGGADQRTFTLTAPANPQQLQFRATVSGLRDANAGNNAATLSVPVVGQPDLKVTRPSGAEAIGSFAHEDYRVTISNAGNERARDVRLVIRGEGTPLDFNSVDITSSNHHGFACRIVNQLAGPLGNARIECTGGDLRPGDAVTVRVRTSTTVVVGSSTGRLDAIADAGNFIAEPNEENNSRSLTIRAN